MTVSNQELKEEVHSELGETFEWKEIDKGVNKVYSINSASRELIIKIESENQVDSGISLEPEIYKIIAEETSIPSPKVLYSNISSQGTEETFYIMEKASGTSAGEKWPKTTFQNRKNIIFQYGKILGKLHKLRNFKKHGELRSGKNGLEATKESKSWHRRFQQKVDNWQKMIEQEWPNQSPKPLDEEKIIRKNIENNPKPVLIHEDNRLDNIFIQDSKITGFLDWSSPESGYKKYDLARAEYLLIDGDTTHQNQQINTPKQKTILRKNLQQGYKQTNQLNKNWMKSTERQLYRYSTALSIAAEFKEWGKNLEKEEHKETRKELINRIEEQQPKELLN